MVVVPLFLVLALYPPALLLVSLLHLGRAALAVAADAGLAASSSSGVVRAFSPAFF
jgi:hypothetical protein